MGKVGHYLSDSLEVPLKQLYSYAAAPKGGTQDQGKGLQHLSDANTETARDAEDEYGPDTSSLTAFLLSLLSSNTSYPRCSDGPEASEGVPYDSNVSASTSGSWEHHGIDEGQGSNTQGRISIEGLQISLHNSESNDSSMAIPKPNNLTKIQSHMTSQPASPTTPVKLPPLSEGSLLLAESFRAFIYSALPNIVKDRHWIMLYSTAKHGISLRTLYRKSSALSEPFLLVAGDFHGATFGGLVTAPMKPTSKRKYLGTNDMFVFTNVHEKPHIFRATGANRYYLLCMNDAISWGGGGHFALRLDEDLLNGSSGACETFGNYCLATSMEFSIANVELWGFAHATRYA